MAPETVLVDTSAWIASFKKAGDQRLKEFVRQSILGGLAVSCPIIVLELLQGCRSTEERDALRIKLESLDMLPITSHVWEKAYELGFTLRRKGLTIPATDLIIAGLAIEHKSLLLHQDEHYEKISSHFSVLRTKYFKAKT